MGSWMNLTGFMVSRMDSNGAERSMLLEISASECHGVQHQVPCRICGQVGLNSVLLRDDEPVVRESKWPVDLAWCPTCSLVQWTEAASGDSQPRGTSPTGRDEQAAKAIVDRLRESQQLDSDSFIVELIGGDRDILQWYDLACIPVLGIKTARSRHQTREGLPVINAAFDQELALQLVRSNQRADVIHANSAIAHIADLNGVVSGFATLLKQDGIVVVEVPYLKDLANHVGFNTLDRDEMFYFSLTALVQLFGQHGLEVVDLERLKAYGGMLRITAAKSGTMSVSAAVHDMMDDESTWVREAGFYQSFGETLAPSSHERWAA